MSTHPTIFACTPLHDGKVHHQYLGGALQCMRRFGGRIRWDVKIGSFLPRNRDVLTARFLASGCSHMLCIDSDIGFTADDVEALLEVDEDFVGGCYAMKVASQPIPAKLLSQEQGPLKAADYVPAGFILVKRTVIERMVEHYSDLHYSTPEGDCWALWASLFGVGGSYDGEDVAFCRRWRRMGGRVWLHRGVIVRHVGERVFTPEQLPRRTVQTMDEVARVVKRHSLLHDPPKEIRALGEAFAETGGKRFLEIGTWRGATSAAMRQMFPAADVVTVELPNVRTSPWNAQNEHMVGIAHRELGMLDSIRQLRCDSADLLEHLDGEVFDLVFVDGDHSRRGCMSDLKTAAALLADGGAIVVHDYTDETDEHRPNWTQSVASAVDQFAADECWQKTRLAGWLVQLKRADAAAAGDTTAA